MGQKDLKTDSSEQGKIATECQACLLYFWVVWKLWFQYDAYTILCIHLLYFCQAFVVTCKRSLCQKECSEILIPSVKETQRKAGRRDQMCSQDRKICPAHCICISVIQHREERSGSSPSVWDSRISRALKGRETQETLQGREMCWILTKGEHHNKKYITQTERSQSGTDWLN